MLTLDDNELIIDSFAGGGGASQGIFMATGRHPDVAINHDPEAVAMHAVNHPGTEHHCQSIYRVDPDDVIRKYQRPIGLAWFSPDCTHHSKARGDKPKEKHIRDLAWIVVHWAERAVYRGQRPRVIIVENVEEFKDWGPLLENGKPCPIQKGFEFQRWVKALRKLGYKVDWRELRACDFGAPTIRKRLFIVARCDGERIVWPTPTHGKGLIPYRTAAECIDWNIPCPSIFERKRPLAENTLRRIAKGIQRYVIDSPKPFIVNMAHGGKLEPFDEPMRTIATEKGGCRAVIAPTLIEIGYGERAGQAPRAPGLDKPLGTVVAGGVKHALVAPVLVGAGGPSRAGEPKRTDKPLGTLTQRNHTQLVTAFLAQHNTGAVGHHAEKPLSTITQEGSQQAVVTAFLSQHNGQSIGADVEKPNPTIMGKQKHSLVTSHLIKLKGTCKDGQPVDEPMPTVQAQGLHTGEVRAFLVKYYGTAAGAVLTEPMHTVTAKERFGLVIIHGQEYIIVDIGMRMLAPRELYRAQGFPDSYIIEFEYKGKPLTKTAQVRMCGNSVSPHPARAVILANLQEPQAVEARA